MFAAEHELDPAYTAAEPVVAPPQAEPEVAQAAPAADIAEPEAAELDVAEPAPDLAELAELSPAVEVPAVAAVAPAVEAEPSASEQAYQPPAELPKFAPPEEYRDACYATGQPEKWNASYWRGHTEAQQWIQPSRSQHDMGFLLKHNQSASQALKDFIKGPTIADGHVLAVALEIETVRDTLGDHKFDLLFGSKTHSEDAQIPRGQRLKITTGMFNAQVREQMLAIAEEADEALHRGPVAAQPAAEAEQAEQKPLAEEQAPESELIAAELGIHDEEDFDA